MKKIKSSLGERALKEVCLWLQNRSHLTKKNITLKEHDSPVLESSSMEHSRTLIFIHGFADRKESFLQTATHFYRDYNIVLVDLPGFGEATKIPGVIYNFDFYSEWLSLFLANYAEHKVTLLGNSLGGAIILNYLSSYRPPKHLENFVLINSAGLYLEETTEDINHQLLAGRNIFSIQNKHDFQHLIKTIFYKKPFIPPLIRDYLQQSFIEQNEWHEKILSDVLQLPLHHSSWNKAEILRNALNQKLSSILLPCLIVWGEDDRFFPLQHAYLFHRLLKNASLATIKKCGHCPQTEKTQAMADMVKRYLSDNIPI
jgi:abhydrolase domain-containing protein 6